jgi:hypothetical protein
MSTITLTNDLSLVEQMKRRYNGMPVTVAEVLAQRNELIMNAPMREANDVFTHVLAKRTKLPTFSPRSINQGGEKGHSEVEQVRESIMLLDLQIEIDEALIDHEPDPKAARVIETRAHLEAAAQSTAEQLIYGDPADDPRECLGLATRYNLTTLDNVVGLSGTGNDVTSLWMIEWNDINAYLIYPRGSGSMGVSVVDHGKQRVTDSNNKPYYAYASQIKIELGMAIADDRAVQRLANIETDGSTNNLISADSQMHAVIRARTRLPNMGMDGNTFMYVNRDLKSQFDIYALDKSNGFYMLPDITGRPISTFQGIPIRMVEQIIDETAIS